MNDPAKPITGNPRYLRVLKAKQNALLAFQFYVYAEVLCYHMTGEHLHEKIAEWWEDLQEKVRNRGAVMDTLDELRDLPETGE